jgi:hypothetical protein
MFVVACGLATNMDKTHFLPIRCEEVSLDFLAEAGRHMSSFPGNYLGLPLNIKKTFQCLFLALSVQGGGHITWMAKKIDVLSR